MIEGLAQVFPAEKHGLHHREEKGREGKGREGKGREGWRGEGWTQPTIKLFHTDEAHTKSLKSFPLRRAAPHNLHGVCAPFSVPF